MPVAIGDAHPSRFDGPPRVVGLGFQLTGPRDMFADQWEPIEDALPVVAP
jgi:fructose 1,6-bisphosphate aldolase/phosphatase